MTRQKVLIVDDSDLILEIYKNLLESADFEVITSNTPFGTASIIATEKPNLVLIDLFMPALSGDKLVELVRKDKNIQNTKLILFSSRPSDELKSISASCGADGFIQKKGDHMEVVRNVRSWIAV